jgi:hypothetical protein
MTLKLVKIVKSDNPEKKYMAVFDNDGRTKTTHFGARGMTDYIKSQDPERRMRYLGRHKANEDWNDPTSAGALSRYILWGDSTSFNENVKQFKRRFDL